ncbi:S1C family serine protease [Orrella daihaiensis]|uniref:Trypsin-like peptidase domain-containing protein n=1 Tax=Orrella daihaiensis TaxID=2782176 RepID=A0ABY4AKW5_9BURK|nr:trypsin-like peptidase domain-containing protein [Orrella daihaiensis]UOD50291.1 trypsin-like peptidase domain-containing protein [Orrella daihaiensis]
MKRATLYSRSSPRTDYAKPIAQALAGHDHAPAPTKRNVESLKPYLKNPYLLVVFGLLLGAAIVWAMQPRPAAQTQALTESKVESIVLETLATKTLPSKPAQAAAIVWPSIVKIRTLDGDPPPPGLISGPGKGAGFVIKEDGSILTNYHVVAGSERILVTFADGLESPAVVASSQPERDLAVLAPARIPDDLKPAVLAPSGQLVPGDMVVAVGFPFGMGPSVSAGVVSGLNRSYQIPNGERLEGLIQFDAAVNPGSSGGPLVNQAGEVLGVVTALLNPSPDGAFAGIGFAITMESAANAAGIPPF